MYISLNGEKTGGGVSAAQEQLVPHSVSLAGGEQHGYGLMQDVLERSGGIVRLCPATLYGSLKRLIKEGLIAESDEGRWTIKTAIDEAVPVPVFTAALYARFSSRGEADRSERLRDVTHMLAMNAKRAKAAKQASRVVLVIILVFETFVTRPWQ